MSLKNSRVCIYAKRSSLALFVIEGKNEKQKAHWEADSLTVGQQEIGWINNGAFR